MAISSTATSWFSAGPFFGWRADLHPFVAVVDLDIHGDLGVSRKTIGRHDPRRQVNDRGDHPANRFQRRGMVVIAAVCGKGALELELPEFLEPDMLARLVLFPPVGLSRLPDA